MRKIFSLATTICLFSSLLSLGAARAEVQQKVVITEIGAHETSDGEWIEIYNPSGSEVDITGWKFFEEGTNHGINSPAGSFIIPADTYAVIANKSDIFLAQRPGYVGIVFDSSWSSLKESGEEVGLKDKDGVLVELFTYPATSKTSLERISTTIPASESTNWTQHPSGDSAGKPNEFQLVSQEPEAAVEEIVTEPAQEVEEVIAPPPPAPAPIIISAPPPAPPSTPTPIVNKPPKAVISVQSGALIAEKQTTVNFDGRNSFDPDGDSLTYLWDMGDGTNETTANPSPKKYKDPGTYKITLTVTDSRGAKDTATETILVVKEGATLPEATDVKTDLPKTTVPTSTTKKVPLKIDDSLFGFEISGYLTLTPSTASKNKTSSVTKKSTTKKEDPPDEKISTGSTIKSNGDISNEIYITEIFPAPAKDSKEEEWIEIYNAGKSSVRLGNWRIADAAAKAKNKGHIIGSDTVIGAGKYLLIPKSITKLALNNGTDSVTIFDYNDDIVDEVEYTGGKTSMSYSRISVEGGDDMWQWTLETSPGRQNPSWQKFTAQVQEVREIDGATSIRALMANGTERMVTFSAKDIDPKLIATAMTPESTLQFLGIEKDDQTIEAMKIQEMNPAPYSKNDDEKKNGFPWATMGMIALGIGLNAPPIIGLAKTYLLRLG